MSDLRTAPLECPVCAHDMVITRKGCPECGTELVGEFASCKFCALEPRELELLQVFLASRGNVSAVAKFLSVSYPTARVRLDEVLQKLGLADESVPEEPDARQQILAKVESGELSPEDAAQLLGHLED